MVLRMVGKTACPPYIWRFCYTETSLLADVITMSRYRRANIPGAAYFFTVVTYRRRPILCDAPVRAALRGAIKTVRLRHPLTIDAWVLLPEHLHCVWTLPPGDAHYALRWGLIKRMVSSECAQHYHRTDWMTASKTKHRESTFWQRRYWEHCITTETDYSNHMDYIAINPVKHTLVTRVRDWPYSTFHRDVTRGIYPLNWAGTPDMLDLAFGGGHMLFVPMRFKCCDAN
jgi:putative transposase